MRLKKIIGLRNKLIKKDAVKNLINQKGIEKTIENKIADIEERFSTINTTQQGQNDLNIFLVAYHENR